MRSFGFYVLEMQALRGRRMISPFAASLRGGHQAMRYLHTCLMRHAAVVAAKERPRNGGDEQIVYGERKTLPYTVIHVDTASGSHLHSRTRT